MKFTAFTYPWLESVLKKEIESRKINIDKLEDGLITFSWDQSTMVKTNLWLRTASKVYLLLWEYSKITSFNDLFNIVHNIDWNYYIPKDFKVVVQADSIKSKLSSVPSIQAISQKAIIKKLVWNKTYNYDEDKKIEIRINIFKDNVKVLLNTTWESLYKRWYRKDISVAWLKETLASWIILLSNIKNLYDPFCGSWTLLIEKAMIDLHIAPWLFRHFDFENFDWFDSNLLEKEIWRAKTRQKTKQLNLIWTDIDKYVLKIAKENAKNAWVDKHIHFEHKDFMNLQKHQDYDILTNPPYNKRIKIDNIDDIYAKLQDMLLTNNIWWWIITWYEDFKFSNNFKIRVLSNGWDMVRFIYKKSRKKYWN